MIKKFTDIEGDMEKLREGNPKGEFTGFKALDEFYTIKQGGFTFLHGAPHQGKSELTYELLFNQNKKYGKKGLVSSPETGTVADIYAEFITKYTGYSIYRGSRNEIPEKKYYEATRWVDHNFSIVDTSEQPFSFQELFDMVTDEDIIVADPYNEHKHDMSEFGARQDLYIESEIGNVRRFCTNRNKHMLISLHPAAQQLREDIVNKVKIRYYPMPLAREAAGGQALLRKAMGWINIWRPAKGLVDVNGRPYEDNELVLYIEKARPKGIGRKGILSIYFNQAKNAYYEKSGSKDLYAFEHETTPEIDFTISSDENVF